MNALTETRRPSQTPAALNREAADMLARYRNKIERTPMGKCLISSRFAPTGDDLALLQARRIELADALRPADPAAIAARIVRLFERFPSAKGLDTERTLAAFVADLGRFPLWAIEAGCMAVINREVQLDNPAFPPSAIQMQEICAKKSEKVENEFWLICNILDAKIVDNEVSPEQRERRIRQLKELSEKIAANADPRGRAKQKPLSSVTPREAEANLDHMLANQKPLPPISAALRSMLSNKPEEPTG